MAASLYIPIYSVWEFQFSHIFINTCYYLTFEMLPFKPLFFFFFTFLPRWCEHLISSNNLNGSHFTFSWRRQLLFIVHVLLQLVRHGNKAHIQRIIWTLPLVSMANGQETLQPQFRIIQGSFGNLSQQSFWNAAVEQDFLSSLWLITSSHLRFIL